jgi:branched-chain amino acid transport system ATP-binding protein
MVALIGPNGAGKSTCFNILNGQIKADTGSVIFNGENVTGLNPRDIWERGVGRTFQIPEIYASMTVCENVQMVLLSKHRRLKNPFIRVSRTYREDAIELLRRVGMADYRDQPAGLLAYGDVKRLELVLAISNDPMLLLMDEPTAGMAVEERNQLMQLTADLVKERKLAVLFTEHSMDVVFAYADRIQVLSRGKIIASGTPSEVRDNSTVQEVYLGSSAFLQLRERVPA